MTVVMAVRSSDRGQLLFATAIGVAVVSGRRRGRRRGAMLFEKLRLEAPHAAAQLGDLVTQAAIHTGVAPAVTLATVPEPSW